jgi:hypothetical protein
MFKKLKLTHLPFIIFIIGYFLICGLTYKDFGITDDEKVERRAAKDLAKFLREPSNPLIIMGQGLQYQLTSGNSHHPLVSKYQRSYQLVQNILNPTDFWEWDHLINMIFASLLFIVTYIISYIQYKSSLKSMVLVGFLFFMPRLIGDIPANNKDTPFAVMYLSCLAAIYLTTKLKFNTYLEIILLGIVFGFTQTYRAIGFSIYPVYILYFVITSLQEKNLTKERTLNFFYKLVIIGFMGITISILFFPWLGSNLIGNLPAYLFNSSQFQEWNNTILFNGEFLTKDQRPWHYLLTWLLITTPVMILGLLTVGLAKIKSLSKNPLFLLSFISLTVNLGLYFALQPVIYNALRHFLFILPAIAMIAAIAFLNLLEKLKGNYKYALILLVVLNAGTVLYSYVMLHPYQYIYFNELIGGLKGATGKYETDYWGTTYKEAAEWLGAQDNVSRDDYIFTCQQYVSVEYFAKGKFSLLGGKAKPTYAFCDADDEIKKGPIENTEIYHEIKRMGVTLNYIRKYKTSPETPEVSENPAVVVE